MPFPSAARRLAVVEATRFRGHDPAYHRYVQHLVGGVIAESRAQGWDVDRLAAEQGTAGLLAATDAADAVVVVGGEDLHPRFYGGETGYPNESRHLEVADEAQLELVARTVARGVPFLGICRGLQVLDVALGGSLVPDLGDDGVHVRRGVPIEQVLTSHPVVLEPGSRAEALLGGPVVEVRSAHHQAVGRLGADLLVTGRAPDGHVELIEHRTAPALAVQFHPEDRGAPSGQLAAVLGGLRALVAAAA
ncbi:gamma-glutamyl-gamma-aminobutyrate hydrolase family protein [Leifsonia sp. AG29]|uniref:gamma-glutamyl-gamma-aminobutyrate hydrolase family protein n=1 Tax=Leifsonia sp. AG29 TaxID=2598860 RepID=UPI00131DC523|nr:gamma-glutamyl-gamma-aminobutyrate hydrolase family protein [Leifsonia sp. AG29]